MEKRDILSIFRSKSSVFTFKELLISLGETEPVLLRKRLNYYVKKGELHAIRRGIYARDNNYDRLELATKILTPSYVSFETVLAQAGIVFQHYSTIFVASYQTREIECDGGRYGFRKIKDVVLTNTAGIENRGNYWVATKERAFLDTLYLNKDYYFDNLLPLDQKKVSTLLPIYNNKRMVRTVTRYFKSLITDGGLS